MTITSAPKCIIDRSVLNSDTIQDMTDIGLSMFAPLCGKNRGAFVMEPSDGKTYGCIEFPSYFGSLVGVTGNVSIPDANAIKTVYQNGNVTSEQVVDMLDLLVQATYYSTPNVDHDTHGCDVGGLATLSCDSPTPTTLEGDNGMPPTLRAVTLAGLFVDAPWATGGRPLTYEEAKGFYTSRDFREMKQLGLNAVQIPFHAKDFLNLEGGNVALLNNILSHIQREDLVAILVIVHEDDSPLEAIVAAAKFASANQPTVVALTVPPSDISIRAAREAAPTLTLMVPVNEGTIMTWNFDKDRNIIAAMDMNHVSTVADVASSDSLNDRMKLYYHESVACTRRAPLEYTKCFRHVPVFVANGFDLSVDNCIFQGVSDSFVDYGQCNRFNETINSDWWASHRESFASRQIFSFEKGNGWAFSAWKLFDDSNVGVLDSPAKLLSLKDVSAAGLFPNLSDTSLACLNPPMSDFVLGDDTLAPSPGPPPDCGNGWWNWDLQACEYWIPPTASPSEPCPTCPECVVQPACAVCPTPLTREALLQAGVTGGAVALAIGYLGLCLFGRRTGYTTLPS